MARSGRAGFSGYIFVALDPDRDRWRSINGTFSVARLVCAHGRPTPVPTGVVEALLATVDETGLVRFDGGLRPGQPVRVLTGPFAQILRRAGSARREGTRSCSVEDHGLPGADHD